MSNICLAANVFGQLKQVWKNKTIHPIGRIDLEEWEYVTCMKTVALRSQETVSGLKGYIAAGTCLMQGEEVTCRGRVSSHRQTHTSAFHGSS